MGSQEDKTDVSGRNDRSIEKNADWEGSCSAVKSNCRAGLAGLVFSFGLGNPASATDVALGEYLSGQCTTCHQLSGKVSGIPAIVGWDSESFVAVMQSYKRKEREHQVMRTIAGSLSDEDIAALAAYFATIKPATE